MTDLKTGAVSMKLSVGHINYTHNRLKLGIGLILGKVETGGNSQKKFVKTRKVSCNV